MSKNGKKVVKTTKNDKNKKQVTQKTESPVHSAQEVCIIRISEYKKCIFL